MEIELQVKALFSVFLSSVEIHTSFNCSRPLPKLLFTVLIIIYCFYAVVPAQIGQNQGVSSLWSPVDLNTTKMGEGCLAVIHTVTSCPDCPRKTDCCGSTTVEKICSVKCLYSLCPKVKQICLLLFPELTN